MKRTILIPITSRASYGRLKSVIKNMQQSKRLEPYVVLACSALLDKYGDLRHTLIKDNIMYHKELNPVFAGDHLRDMVKTQGEFTKQVADLLYEVQPDMVLVHADRYEMLSVAIAAKFMGIKIIHTQGGEVSGCVDDDVRNMITLIADYHFPSNYDAAKRIEDLRPDLSVDMGRGIFTVGCPSLDLIAKQDLRIVEDLNSKYGGVGNNIDFHKPFAFILVNPDTKALELDQIYLVRSIIDTITSLGLQAVWIWGNIDAGGDVISKEIRKARERGSLSNVKFFKNLEPEDYYRVMNSCCFMIGNSSSGIREGSFLAKPFICVGNRQKGRDMPKNVYQIDTFDLISAKTPSGELALRFEWNYQSLIDYILTEIESNLFRSNYDKHYYGNGTAGKQIVKILEDLIPCSY